jgi:hypothetical protein
MQLYRMRIVTVLRYIYCFVCVSYREKYRKWFQLTILILQLFLLPVISSLGMEGTMNCDMSAFVLSVVCTRWKCATPHRYMYACQVRIQPRWPMAHHQHSLWARGHVVLACQGGWCTSDGACSHSDLFFVL